MCLNGICSSKILGDKQTTNIHHWFRIIIGLNDCQTTTTTTTIVINLEEKGKNEQ